MEKPITIPIAVPSELEDYIYKDLLPSISDLPHSYTRRRTLNPIHDTRFNRASATLPSLSDSDAETGNLRYWVVDNDNLWAGQHAIIDELSELYNSIYHSQSPLQYCLDASRPEFLLDLAHMLRRRTVSPDSSFGQSKFDKNMDRTENLLFQAWILSDPGRCNLDHGNKVDAFGNRRRPEFDQDDYTCPAPEFLFWREGDEGSWPSHFIPEWKEVPQVDDAESEQWIDGIRRCDTFVPNEKNVMPASDLGFTQFGVRFSRGPKRSGRTFADFGLDYELL